MPAHTLHDLTAPPLPDPPAFAVRCLGLRAGRWYMPARANHPQDLSCLVIS